MSSLPVETLSGRLGFSVLCFAVLEVVCRARGADTDCSGRAVLEADQFGNNCLLGSAPVALPGFM